jgi:hypothetical protein
MEVKNIGKSPYPMLPPEEKGQVEAQSRGKGVLRAGVPESSPTAAKEVVIKHRGAKPK